MTEELKTIDTVDTSPFKKLVMTIGELPTSFVESMTYYELLAWLCNYLQGTIIPAVNNNGEAVTELQQLYIELKTFVDNYFDNLDVQEEINNKLDAMAEAGTLQEIITEYINTTALWMFDTVSDMISATNLINGSYARTLGHDNINDGGGATYKIRTKTLADTEDNITKIFIGDTLVAELTYEYNIPKASVSDIENFMKTRADVGHTFYANGLYEFDNPINLYTNSLYDFEGQPSQSTASQVRGGRCQTVRIVGSGSENTIFKATNGNALFTADVNQTPVGYIKFEFENITFLGDDFQNTPFDIKRSEATVIEFHFKNCNFNKFNYGFYYNKFESNVGSALAFTHFTDCNFYYNNYGLFITQDNVEFNSCYTKYNRIKGLLIHGSNVVNYNGGKIEYNGFEADSLGNDGNQVTIYCTSSNINFNGMYLEPSDSGTIANNRGTSPILIDFTTYNDTTYVNSINFDKSRFNGLESISILAIKGTGDINGLYFSNSYILNLILNANKDLIVIKSGTPTITNCLDTSVYRAIKDSSENYITDYTKLNLLHNNANAINITPQFANNLLTATQDKGTSQIIAGCFNTSNLQTYYGDKDFSFTVDETNSAIITVTLKHSNIKGNNTAYFPVFVTLRDRSASSTCVVPTVEWINATSFKIHCRATSNNAYNNTGYTISFMCLINY